MGRKLKGAQNKIIFASLFALFGGFLIVSSFASTPGSGCTTTVNSVSAIQQAVSSAADGDTVCVTAGTYGHVTLTRAGTSHTANVTLKPDPSLDPNGAGKVTMNGINIAGNYITVHNFYFTGSGVEVGTGVYPFPGFTHITIDHNNVGPVSGYGIHIGTLQTGTPSTFITISNNKIHDTSATTEGDAIRLDGWRDVTVTGNEIYNIVECPAGNCHTDTLQSYQAGVATSNLTINRNYIHDTTNAQGFPFLKDGDISNVTISDNLSLRMPTPGISAFWIDENIPNLTITNNTYQGTSGAALKNDGSLNGTAQINHNVLDQFNTNPGAGPPYTMSEDYNIYTDNNQWSFTIGPHSSLNSNPAFIDTAHDDYRLASNPNNIGVDWKPADYTFGPVQDQVSSGTSCDISVATSSALNTAVTTSSNSGKTICVTANISGSRTWSTQFAAMTHVKASPADGTISLSGTQFTGAKNISLEGFALGAVGINGASSNLEIHDSTVTSQVNVDTTSMNNSSILIDGNKFMPWDANGSEPEGRLEVAYPGGPGTHDAGVTVSNNEFIGPGCSDGIQLGGRGILITHNVIHGMRQGSCGPHVDGIQMYGAANVTFTYNLVYDCDTGIIDYNTGGFGEVAENNAIRNIDRDDENLVLQGPGLIARHNTIDGTLGVGSEATNAIVTNNVVGSINPTTAVFSQYDYNMFRSSPVKGGSHSFVATPILAGGNSYSSYQGAILASNSPGYNGGSDGKSIGVTLDSGQSGGTTKVGDFNSDGVVNIYDLGIFLSKWQSTTATAQDLNSDGIVNIYDLGAFLSHYGT